MAKKRVPSSRKAPATAPRSSSSMKVNSFMKGMNKDITPSMENNQAWWHARNVANNSEDGDVGIIGNEPSNLQCGVIPYTIIGVVHRYGDEWIIYSTDDVNSEIGRFDDSECKYTTLVNDPCLKFNRKFLITGAAKENFDCTWQVYWDDANNPSRTLNIDKIPYKTYISSSDGDPCIVYSDILPKQLDCEKIRLAPLLDTPCVKLSKSIDGGMLLNGAYQAFVAYVENDVVVTDYIGLSNIQTLWDHDGRAGSLNISLSNLDKDYENFELVLLIRNQISTFAKQIGIYSTESESINIDFIDPSLLPVDVKLLPQRTPAYEKSESMFVVNDWLIRQGPTTQFDFNYQPLANNIKVNWVVNRVSSSYYSLGGNKMGFMRDEQYAFFIRWIYNTGERSSSYHIPGRAPRNYTLANGTVEKEDAIIYGDNVLDIDGDPVYKVYNTGTIQQTNLSEIQEDGTIVIAKGEMGYWESTEKYPTNKPDIWGDLCGEPIRHHKMPNEEIGGVNSPLHITTDTGDSINVLGVEFESISRPKNNDGTYIQNVVGYELLRGSRQGARSILGKGLFRNMRKYTVPNAENLIGNSVQGLYPNYPYNDLNPDVYFHDGLNAGDLNRTDGCDSFAQSIDTYKALGDRADVNGEPAGFSRKAFTFASPDLMFTKPSLNAYETRIYGQLSGSSTGYFLASENHPQFKLLRNGATVIASIIGLGYAIHQLQGTDETNREGAKGNLSSTTGSFLGPAGGGNMPGPFFAGYATATAASNVVLTAEQVVIDLLMDNLGKLADLWVGGGISVLKDAAYAVTSQNAGDIPGVQGGTTTYTKKKDTSTSSLPLFIKVFTSRSISKSNLAIGGNEILDLIYNMISESEFVYKYNSAGFFNKFSKQNTGLWRIKNEDSNYIGSTFQTFDDGKYKINNLYRPTTVAVSLDKPLQDPLVKDTSRFVIGGRSNLRLNASGEWIGDATPVPTSDRVLLDHKEPRKSSISGHYGALKFNFDNQYGQIEGIKQIQMRGCVELLDDTIADATLYKSSPIFAGDVFIGRYTEKVIMPIFSNFLLGQPDGFTFDYSLYVNIPYPRYWLNSQRYDITPLANKIINFGIGSSSSVNALLPNDLYYLDRGQSSCSTNWLNIFGRDGDKNPAFAMEFAYSYSHSNGMLDFFVESEINLAQRDWEDPPARQIYSPSFNNDIDELFHANIEKKDNFYKYDESLSPSRFATQIINFGQVQPRYYDPNVAETCFTKYPKRLIYSLQAQEESRKDYWRVFLNFNYKDFKNEVSIIKPVSQNGAVIFFPYLSPQLFSGTDTLKTQGNTKLTIGDGGLFSSPMKNIANSDISNEYGSCESLRGVMNTPMGLFYISQAQGKIFHFAGKGLDPISNNGMKWWFAKYLPSRFIKQFPNSENTHWTDNPVLGVGCQVIYDVVDDIVYFMKKDYQIKPEYIKNAEFTDTLSKPVVITLQTGAFRIDIGDPLYFDDCSWTVSYDPKSRAWISFHDWHPELAIPSINHFFTTKSLVTDNPQCPPGYNYNTVTGLCESGINTSDLATVNVTEIGLTPTGGVSACLIDLVIAMDVSGSTGNPLTPGSRAYAQLEWVKRFVANPQIQAAMSDGTLQMGFTAWSNPTGQLRWNDPSLPGYDSVDSMSNNVLVSQVDSWYKANWPDFGSTAIQQGQAHAVALASDAQGSSYSTQYPARSNSSSYRRVVITVTDTEANPGSSCSRQSVNASGNTAVNGPSFQYMYAVFCGVNSVYPTAAVGGVSLAMNGITCTNGPITITTGTAGLTTDAYQYGIKSTISASYPITNWDTVADALVANVCAGTFECECPAGYTKVFLDPVLSTYTSSTGDCNNITPPICRKVECLCPTSPAGSVTTVTGTCPDSGTDIYNIGNPEWINPDPRICNFFYTDVTESSFKVGSIWRHNVRCDSFVNYYNVNYPWEIDLISNTGQSVNTVRSFEYQLETYVYKGDPQYNMCGGDKWEDFYYNFDSAIIYNNDQVSGLLVLNTQLDNDPWGELTYPIIGTNNIDILSSKVEHKFRFNQFWDITNNRGQRPSLTGITTEQSIFNTSCNGYVRPLNSINLNYDKEPTQRKKFRHYSNQIILRKNVSGNRKMLLRLTNTKLLLSMR